MDLVIALLLMTNLTSVLYFNNQIEKLHNKIKTSKINNQRKR